MGSQAYHPNRRRTHHRKNRRSGQSFQSFWRILPGLLTLVTVLCLIYEVFTSPLLSVRHVKVYGLHTVHQESVIQAAQVPMGRNIFFVGLGKIARRTQKYPAISHAMTTWRFPNTVAIHVIERQPAFVLVNGESLFEVDHTGIPYREIQKPLNGIPLVSLRDIKKFELGQPISTSGIKWAFKCLDSGFDPVSKDISKISVDQNGNLCLNIKDGVEVRLGQPDKLYEKLAYLDKTRTSDPQTYQQAQYLDLSCLDAPAIRLKETTGTPEKGTND